MDWNNKQETERERERLKSSISKYLQYLDNIFVVYILYFPSTLAGSRISAVAEHFWIIKTESFAALRSEFLVFRFEACFRFVEISAGVSSIPRLLFARRQYQEENQLHNKHDCRCSENDLPAL